MSSSLPTRPRMPSEEEERRSTHTRERECVLLEDFDETLHDYMQNHVSEQRLSKWGPPDTSANPLADISRQLSTPGLYGSRPTVRHLDDRNDPLIGEGGLLDQAGVWTKSQFLQYLVLGAGDWLVRPDVDPETGAAIERLVSPADVYVQPQPHRPDQWGELGELRCRWWEQQGKWVYTWDVYTVSAGQEPRLRIYEAKQGGGFGDDVTNVFAPADTGAWEGEAYPWVYADGQPYIPFVRYRWADTGRLWNTFLRRGTHRGTLNTSMYATFAGRSALDATGTAVLVFGAAPPPANVVQAGGTQQVRTLEIEPGAMIFLQPEGEFQPSATQIGPGANLPVLSSFVQQYAASLAAAYGLNASDVTRVSADPTSGFALFVSERGKRMVQRQVEPLFRASDLERLRMHAAMQKAAGNGQFDEQGYSITYSQIEDSPQEQQAARDEIDWQVERGYLSPIDAYQRLNPGTSRADARAAILQARREKAELDAEVADALTSPPPAAAGTPAPQE